MIIEKLHFLLKIQYFLETDELEYIIGRRVMEGRWDEELRGTGIKKLCICSVMVYHDQSLFYNRETKGGKKGLRREEKAKDLIPLPSTGSRLVPNDRRKR